MAFPILFEPVKIGGELYADGGVRHDIFVNLSHISVQHVITLEQTINSHNILADIPRDWLEDFSVKSIEDFKALNEEQKSEQLTYAAMILDKIDFEPSAYIVINGKTAIEKDPNIKPKLVPLAGRTITIMLKQSLYGSLYEIYYDLMKDLDEEHEHWNFFYTKAPESFDKTCKFIQFEPRCTKKLYKLAKTAGSAETPPRWCKLDESAEGPWCPKFPAY